jgi:arylsulfatase A-like enzyme
LLALALLVVSLGSQSQVMRVAQAQTLPNIVVIMVDDLDEDTFNQLLIAGKLPKIKTHLIDKGMRFTESFVTDPVCCPSRATFLTGQYAHNHKVYTVGRGPNEDGIVGGFHGYINYGGGLNRPTVASTLKDANYHTGFAGKFMNSYTGTVPAGWDFWRGIVFKSDYYGYGYDPRPAAPATPNPNSQPVYGIYSEDNSFGEPDVYQTKLLGEIGKLFINDNAKIYPAGKPFFLFLAPTAPHVVAAFCTANNADPDCGSINNVANIHLGLRFPVRPDRAGFKGYKDEYPADYGCNFPKDCMSSYPLPQNKSSYFNNGGVPSFLPSKSIPDDKPNREALLAQHRARLEAMISIDVMVGKLIAALGAKIDNTLIIFTSDNGFQLGEHRLTNKGIFYEESIRVPLIIRKPNNPTQTVGKFNTALVSNNDLAPTILGFANMTGTLAGVDGLSLRPLLEEVKVAWRQWLLIEGWKEPGAEQFSYNKFKAIRTSIYSSLNMTPGANPRVGNLTYVTFPDSKEAPKLYDMTINTTQTSDVRLSSTQLVTALQPTLNALVTCSGATCNTAEGVASGIPYNTPLDTRDYLNINGQTVESITANGRYWNFYLNGNALASNNGSLLTSVSRYIDPINGKPAPCSFSLPGELCKFDSRTHITLSDGRTVESITAYGRFWNFVGDTALAVSNGDRLTTVPRYAKGPCAYAAGELCKFDTRSHFKYNEQIVESITAYGRYWNFIGDTLY